MGIVSARRNWMAVVGLLLGLVAVLSYFLFVTPVLAPRLPWLRDVPLLNFVLVGIAVWLSWIGVRRGRWPAKLGATINVALAALFAYYVFGLSSGLPGAAGAPRVGQLAPDFALTDHRGRTVRLADLRGGPVVLVFYRGFW
jgi:hypothetical protein